MDTPLSTFLKTKPIIILMYVCQCNYFNIFCFEDLGFFFSRYFDNCFCYSTVRTYKSVYLQHVRESLTSSNIPHGECVICLDEFNAQECAFTRTSCYHFFHCACVLRYVKHCTVEHEKELQLTKNNPSNRENVLKVFRLYWALPEW